MIVTTLLTVLYKISFKKILKTLLWIYSLKSALEPSRNFFSFFVREECIYAKTINIISLYKF